MSKPDDSPTTEELAQRIRQLEAEQQPQTILQRRATRRGFLFGGILSGATALSLFGSRRVAAGTFPEDFHGMALLIGDDADKPTVGGSFFDDFTEYNFVYFAQDTGKIYYARTRNSSWQLFGSGAVGGGGGGGLFDTTVSKSSDYTASDGELVHVDASGGAVTITLPPPSDLAVVGVKKTDSSSNVVTVQRNGTESVDNNNGIKLNAENEFAGVESDGTDWWGFHQVGDWTYVSPVTSVTWETSTDWDNATSESGVVHESTSNTDHGDATIVKQGYPYGSFDVISPTPVAAWPLHEDSGSTANDLAGSNDGSITGATLGETGLLGTTAYSFDGTDDKVEVSDSSSLNPDTITFAAWGKADDYGATNPRVLSKGGGPYQITYLDSNSNMRVQIDVGGSTYTATLTSNAPTGSWFHAAGVFDGDKLRAYWNGSQNDSTTVSGTLDDDTDPLWIGVFDTGAVNPGWWDGHIADVRIYSSALSASEIQTLYDVVDTQGTLTTDWQSMDADATSLVTDSTIPANTSLDITVEQDTNNDGTADNTQSVSLSGGSSESNSLSGFSDTSGRYRVVIKPDQTDVVSASTLNSAEVKP